MLYAAPLPPRAYSDIFGGLRFALESHSETLHNSFRGSVHAVAPCAYAVQIKVHEAESEHSLRCFGGISLAPKCFVNRVAEFRLLPVIAGVLVLALVVLSKLVVSACKLKKKNDTEK